MMCIAEEEEATWCFHDASDQEGVLFSETLQKISSTILFSECIHYM